MHERYSFLEQRITLPGGCVLFFDLLDFIKNKEVFQYKDGYVDIPKKPGLGLEIDEDMVKEVSAEGLHWTNPKWRNYDGTMAEW